MTAFLKSLELNGYKTFASRTDFEFAEAITAIVGPNGSGKSNIADAIRWVLGEQSYSLLRGRKTADMIFSGSEQRPRAGMASATVLFDNSEGWLPIDYSEVSIARRAYRDGQNEYLINGQRVRLRDVSELLAKSGLAERTYTIIGQGLVDAVLSLRADERRRLFEEAAGIKKYKFRRKSAIRKLETTDHELVRLSDVISEVQKTVNSLSRQVGKARRYHQFKNDLKQKEIYIYQLRNKHYSLDLTPLQEEYTQVRQTRERLGKEVNQGETELEKLQVKAADLEKVFREVSNRLSSSDEKVREIQQKVRLDEQKIESLQGHSEERQTEIGLLEKKLIEYDEARNNLKREFEQGQLASDARENEYQENLKLQGSSEEQLSIARKRFQEFRQKNMSYSFQ